MKLLKEIEAQKALVEKLQEHENRNKQLLKGEEQEFPEDCRTLYEMMNQILDYNQMDITFRIKQQKQLLDKMIADIPMRTIEFEKDSREANLNMEQLLKDANMEYKFKNAPVITKNSINDVVTKYNLEKENLEQDDKNNIYFELKRLLTVAKKWR